MPNPIDTPLHRKVLGARNTEEFLRASAHASYLCIIATGGSSTPNTIYTCEHSALSAAVIWLQERGVVIPADILSVLEIEDVRHG